MKFEVENFGLIEKANIDIGKINIVTGKNNIGKSNLSKIMYCFLAPSAKDYEMITEYRIYLKLLHVLIKYKSFYNERIEDGHELLYDDKNWECLELARQRINEKEKPYEYALKELDRIEKLFYENSTEQYFRNVEFLFNSEFCYHEGLMRDSKITFYDNDCKRVLEKNKEILDGLYDLKLENVLYMTIEQNEDHYHNTHNRHKSYIHCYEEDKDIRKMVEKISETIKNCNWCEAPSGIMQIEKIRDLLSSGQLSKNSYLLLDNPENDLHPNLQVKFAEILVLMTLKLNIKVYVNTNSPFLTEALEVYSKYYNLYDETNFYHLKKNGETYQLILLDDISIGEIYMEYHEALENIGKIRKKIKLGLNEGYF